MDESDERQDETPLEAPGPGEDVSFRQLGWEEIQRAYRWPRTWFPVLLFVASSWGTWDSFYDGDADRLYGTFPLLAPLVLVSCHVIALGWAKGTAFGKALGRAALIGAALPIPLALANGLFFLIAWMVPANRAAYEGYDGNHYYMNDFGEHLFITTLGTVVMSFGVALIVFILVTLPILVIRAPADVADETRIGQVRSGRIRKVSISLIVFGLSFWTLGGIILVATRGTDDLARKFRHAWRAVHEEYASTEELVWLVGALIALLGAAAIAWGLIQFVIAGQIDKSRNRRQAETEQSEPDSP